MRVSTIKGTFRFAGGFCLILALLLILGALDQGDTESTIILAIGLVFLAVAIYGLFGAPHITRWLNRRFPNDRTPKRSVVVHPRHKLKATIGMCAGLALGFPPLTMALLNLLPEAAAASWSDAVAGCFFLAPIPAVWGAAHLALHRGFSPLIPVILAGFFFVAMWILALLRIFELAMASFVLAYLAPMIVVPLIKGRSHRRRA